MIEDPQVLQQIFTALDSLIGLGIALWIISIGIKRFDIMQDRSQKFTEMVLAQQQQNNDELMQLVSTLCINQTGLTPNPLRQKETAA